MSLKTGGIVGYNLDGNGNDVFGSSNLIITGSSPFGSSYGKINQGMRTNLSSEIGVPYSTLLNITNNFTISFWIRKTSGTSNSYVLSKLDAAATDNNYGIIYDYAGSNILEFYAGGYTGTNPRTGSQISITTGTYHHIVYTYNGSTWSGYKDGLQIFSVSRTFSLATGGTYNLIIGKFSTTIAVAQMDMDMFYMYNRALNIVEVQQLYNNGNGRQYPFSNSNFLTLL